MNNVIFGSGIVGVLAKAILGPSWKIVPFYKSRFFTFNPALDDNFIISHDKIADCVRDLCGQTNCYVYKRAWSTAGQLTGSFDASLCYDWHFKLFGGRIPSQSEPYFNSKMNHFVYDVRVNALYSDLMRANLEEIKTEATKGIVTEVGDHYFIRNGVREEFDHAVSTIPLNAMCQLAGINLELASKPLHYLHVQTADLNFEGYNQLLVTDQAFSFFKVTNVAPGRYLFYFHEEVPNPGVYLMPFMNSFDIVDGTSIEHALPIGQIPKLDWLETKGVYSIGSYAQWDWCMDVSSCILRLINYSARGFKPFQRSWTA